MEGFLDDFIVENKNPSGEALMRWRRAVSIVKNPRRRFRYVADLVKRNEAEKKKRSIQLALSIGVEEISEIQPCSDSPATSLDNYYSCLEPDSDDNGAIDRSETDIDHNFPSTSGQLVSPGHNENHRRDGSKIEVKFNDALHPTKEHSFLENSFKHRDHVLLLAYGQVLELIFFLANFIVELMFTVFDQLSSKHKAPFLLLCLIMSISAVLISIFELLYKLRKERATWTAVWRRCLFDPPSGARVGLFLCIIALTCAFGQFIITTVNYSLYRKHGNAPIKISIWPTIFVFGQLVSSLSSRGAKTEIIVNQVLPHKSC